MRVYHSSIKGVDFAEISEALKIRDEDSGAHVTITTSSSASTSSIRCGELRL